MKRHRQVPRMPRAIRWSNIRVFIIWVRWVRWIRWVALQLVVGFIAKLLKWHLTEGRVIEKIAIIQFQRIAIMGT